MFEYVLDHPFADWSGLADLSSFHHVTPLLPRLDKLLGQGFPPEASTLALQLSNNELSAAVAMMEETPLQDLMTFRLTLSPRSSEGSSPNRRARFKSISVVSPGSLLESDQVRASSSGVRCSFDNGGSGMEELDWEVVESVSVFEMRRAEWGGLSGDTFCLIISPSFGCDSCSRHDA